MKLLEEEQMAIEDLKKNFIIMNNGEIYKCNNYILYNLITKLQKENEELKEIIKSDSEEIKNMSERHFNDRGNIIKFKKVMDKMAEHIYINSNNLSKYFCNGISENICEARGNTEDGCIFCIKLYFYKKVEEENDL